MKGLGRFKRSIFFLLTVLIAASCSEETFKDDADWSFAVIGDIRSNYGIYEELISIIDRYDPKPAFVLINGDIVSNPGNDQEWNRFWIITKRHLKKNKIFTAVGNHDVDDTWSENIYLDHVSMPGNELYYTFDHDDFHIVVIDSEIPGEIKYITGNQFTWLTNVLNAAEARSDINTIVIIVHRPLFSKVGSNRNINNRDEVQSLLETYSKVKIVIAGHDHCFYSSRRNGILHITSGGGGSPLNDCGSGTYYHFTKIGIYEAENRINIKTIDLWGQTIEDFNL